MKKAMQLAMLILIHFSTGVYGVKTRNVDYNKFKLYEEGFSYTDYKTGESYTIRFKKAYLENGKRIYRCPKAFVVGNILQVFSQDNFKDHIIFPDGPVYQAKDSHGSYVRYEDKKLKNFTSTFCSRLNSHEENLKGIKKSFKKKSKSRQYLNNVIMYMQKMKQIKSNDQELKQDNLLKIIGCDENVRKNLREFLALHSSKE